jgi:hypothetical protein
MASEHALDNARKTENLSARIAEDAMISNEDQCERIAKLERNYK